jgi:hypothetical protein
MDKTEITLLKAQAQIELDRLEAQASARDVASKAIGKDALFWIFALVLVGVASSAFLPNEALPAVIGLVATATMALIQMVNGIVNEAKKEEKPEITIIKNLIERLSEREQPMSVEVGAGGRVTVTKGADRSVIDSAVVGGTD